MRPSGGAGLCAASLVTFAFVVSFGDEPAIAATESSPVEAYLEALDRGSFKDAMSVRCESSRVRPGRERQFMNEVRMIRDDLESLEPAVLESVPSAGLGSSSGAPVEAAYGYRLTRVDGALSVWMVVVTVVEDGAERLCGWFPDRSTLLDDLDVDATDFELVDPELASISGPRGDSFVQADYEQRDPTEPIFSISPVASWTRAWMRKPFGGARVSAISFDSIGDALSVAAERLEFDLSVPAEEFDVMVIGAVGVRLLPSTWTWIQVPGTGPVCDEVTLVATTTVVWISACGLEPTEGHELVDELVGQVVPVLR